MKISFSTLGCPEWSWKEIMVTAKDLGYDGIELRGIGNDIYLPHSKLFSDDKINTIKQEIKDRQLKIPCITSSCYLHKEDKDFYLREGKEYIDLATKLGSPYIRVLGDTNPEPGNDINDLEVAKGLEKLGDYAAQSGVVVLIETNGVFADSERMVDLMTGLSHPNIGVLWDIHHPYRYFSEPVERTFNHIGEYIHHVHIKDSVWVDDKIKYCLLGGGDIPIGDALAILKENGYNEFISLEWVKRWYDNLEEPGLVFPHFIHTIKELI